MPANSHFSLSRHIRRQGPNAAALVVAAMLLPAASAIAGQAEPVSLIEFDATNGTPVTEVIVKKQRVRFALDPVLGPYAAVNPEAAPGLGLKGLPIGSAAASIDGAQIKGKVARFGISVDGRKRMVSAALLGRSHLPARSGAAYALAGGFEALPADRIIVQLNKGLSGPMEELVFTRPPKDKERGFPVSIDGIEMRLMFQFANPHSWLDRRAAQALVDQGTVRPFGAISTIPVWFGLEMPVQSVKSSATLEINGLPLSALQARTAEPLALPEPDENVIIVSAQRDDNRPPVLLLGTGSLSHCVQMTFEQATRRLTLTCRAGGV